MLCGMNLTDQRNLEVCVLGSGSGGNATLLRCGGGVMMIDAGFGPRTLTKRMAGTGTQLTDISAICLTHLDHDHMNPNLLLTIIKQKIRVFCHDAVRDDLMQIADCHLRDDEAADNFADLVSGYQTGQVFEPLPQLAFNPLRLAHDAEGSHGFVVSAQQTILAYATDLGRVPDELIARFCGADIVCLEANYDPEMQKKSDRPWYLKQRIMGGKGHLSNEQSLAAVRAILDQSEKEHHHLPRHIVLLHRSRQCNCPNLLRQLFESDVRIKPRLTLTDQFTRTEWLRVAGDAQPLCGEQLAMGF